MNTIDGMRVYFQSTPNFPSWTSRVRSPSPALRIKRLESIHGLSITAITALSPATTSCDARRARLYGDGKLTLARAAREAGVSLWEMMDYARTKKIAAQYDLEDFQRDLKIVYPGVKR